MTLLEKDYEVLNTALRLHNNIPCEELVNHSTKQITKLLQRLEAREITETSQLLLSSAYLVPILKDYNRFLSRSLDDSVNTDDENARLREMLICCNSLWRQLEDELDELSPNHSRI